MASTMEVTRNRGKVEVGSLDELRELDIVPFKNPKLEEMMYVHDRDLDGVKMKVFLRRADGGIRRVEFTNRLLYINDAGKVNNTPDKNYRSKVFGKGEDVYSSMEDILDSGGL